MKRNAVGGRSFDLVLSTILRDGSGLSRGGFGPEPLPWTPCTAASIDCLASLPVLVKTRQ